jgi:hypothetical protein
VPPQPTTFGELAGKSTTSAPVPSREPVSPAATNTGTPAARAAANTLSNAVAVRGPTLTRARPRRSHHVALVHGLLDGGQEAASVLGAK